MLCSSVSQKHFSTLYSESFFFFSLVHCKKKKTTHEQIHEQKQLETQSNVWIIRVIMHWLIIYHTENHNLSARKHLSSCLLLDFTHVHTVWEGNYSPWKEGARCSLYSVHIILHFGSSVQNHSSNSRWLLSTVIEQYLKYRNNQMIFISVKKKRVIMKSYGATGDLLHQQDHTKNIWNWILLLLQLRLDNPERSIFSLDQIFFCFYLCYIWIIWKILYGPWFRLLLNAFTFLTSFCHCHKHT